MDVQRRVEPQLLDLAYDLGLPLVATNEPFFAVREDYEAHDALIAIAEGRVKVDGAVDTRKRAKLRPGQVVVFAGESVALVAE